MMPKIKLLCTFAIFVISTFLCISTHAQNKLPKKVLKELSKKITLLRKADKNFNKDILGVFTSQGATIEEAEEKLNGLQKNKETQKMLCRYWYDINFNVLFYNDELRGTYVSLIRYFRTNFLFNDEKSAFLAKFIGNLEFLTPEEKQALREQEKSASVQKTKELRLLDSIFNLQKINKPQYDAYQSLMLSDLYNTLFEKDEEIFRSEKAVHIKDEQFNIDMVATFIFKREYVLPSSFKVQDWEGHPAGLFIKTLKGKPYTDLIFLVSRGKYPITRWQYIYVKTMATYENIAIRVARGFCTAELGKGNITYAEHEPLSELAKTKIAEKLKGNRPGLYEIRYYLGNVADRASEEIFIKSK